MAVSMKALENRLTGPLGELENLANEGNEIGVIPQNIKKSLDSADHRVAGILKLKYLLVHALSKKENESQYSLWLKVLLEYGISSEIVEQLTTFGALDIYEFDFSDSWSRQSSYDNAFSEVHIPALVEVLIECSAKWQEIGLSLSLPYYILEDIRKTCSINGGRVCLSVVLKEWVVGGHFQTKAATIENLESALRSETAGYSVIASHLRENLEKHGVCCVASPAPKKLRSLNRPFEIIRQSRETDVNQGKSTLLEVQVVSSVSDPALSFQWFKDGCRLKKDNVSYSGTNRQVLCINKACLSSQGVFTCRVQLDEGPVVMSDPINVTVAVETMVGKLISRYLQSPKYGSTWPPVSKNAHIDLVLIAHRSSVGEIPDYRLKGDVDDYIKKEENVKYSEVFSHFKGGLFFLIEGRPGSGKTTLVQKVSRDWAAGEGILNGAELVFVITLRMLSKTKHNTMADILNLFYLNEELSKEVSSYINQTDGKGVCFLIDGLDEYSTSEGKKSLIYKIIQKEYLYHAMVIVASRPVAAGELRHRSDVHLEVLGFSKTQITEFIECYPFTSPYAAEKLNAYLNKHINILHMCYLPVHAAMICFLYDIIKENLPNTETGVYKHFTVLTVLRAVKRSDKDIKLSSLEDLPVEQLNFFLQICKLAFSMTSTSRQVFEANEVDFASNSGTDVPFLGLVTVGSSTGVYDYQDLYTFVHLTFQEYLAAYYISKMEEGEQINILQLHAKTKHMKNTFKFYCGLANFENDFKFLEVINASTDRLFHCQCAFESQQPNTCKCIVTLNEHNGLSFKELTLTASDFMTIDFVVKNASSVFQNFSIVECNLGGLNNLSTLSGDMKLCKNLEFLDLSSNEIGDEGTDILAAGIGRLSKLKYINFSRNEIGSEGLKALASCLTKCTNLVSFDVEGDFGSLEPESLEWLGDCLMKSDDLEVLNIARHSIGDEGAEVLTQCLARCNTLNTLKLDWNQIGDDGMNALVQGLRHCLNLQSFEFEGNSITSKGLKIFAESLKCWGKITLLNFGSNEIGDDGAMHLFENLVHSSNVQTILLPANSMTQASCQFISDCFRALRKVVTFDVEDCKLRQGLKAVILGLNHCDGLQHLNFGNSGMGVEASCALSDSLKNWPSLEKLILLRNNFGSEGARKFAVNLPFCTNLKELDISCNNIDAASAVLIAEGLRPCKFLKVLHLESNKIADEGVEAIASSFRHWQSLTYLNLHDNKIGNDGMKAVSANLNYLSKTLQSLDLSFNEIGDDGAETIADSLKNCEFLNELKLNSNRIGDEGAQLLARNLKFCRNLTTLELVENPLGEEGAQALAGNVKVDKMDFSFCNIGDIRMRDIAEDLKGSHDLVTLFLDNNQIGDEGAVLLGSGLKNCNSLHDLYLQNNNIGEEGAKGLKVGLKCCDIRVLRFGMNHIGDSGMNSLAEGLVNCANLEELYLEQNNIANQGAEGLGRILEACKKIEWIDLNRNLIGSEGAVILSKSLKYGENLQTLVINYNIIGDKGCAALSKNIKPCSNLQCLGLAKNNIGDFGVKELSKHLKYLQLLKELYLSDNIISADGAIYLADGLKYCSSLEVFRINKNCVGEGITSLAKGLKHCSNLESVDFDSTFITDNGAKSLAKSLKRCQCLSEMSLRHNLILDDGVKAIAENLKLWTHCLTLHIDQSKLSLNTVLFLAENLNSMEADFSNCNISAMNCRVLLENLENCTGLEKLNLSYNQLEEDGMNIVAPCLKSFCFLESICLDNNQINDASMRHLVSGLRECNQVTALSLRNNYISNEGAELIGSLLSIDTLQVLDLNGNRISASGIEAMSAKLITCTSITSLDVGFNLIGDKGAIILAGALENCGSLWSLTLDHNKISDDGTNALSTLFQHCRYLCSVSLAYNSISQAGVKQLSSSMQDVKSLNLSNNHLGCSGMKSLLQLVKSDYKLEILNLGSNVGSDKTINELFTSNNQIKTLILDHNRIGEAGIKTLAKGLKTLPFLTSLILDYNKLNDDCIAVLADSLKGCFRLKVLSLAYNRIGDSSIKYLAENLVYCHGLKELSLACNSIGDESLEHLLPLISICRYVENIDLSFNKISDKGAKIFTNSTCQNLVINLFGNPCLNTYHSIGRIPRTEDDQLFAREVKFSANQQMLSFKSCSFPSGITSAMCNSLENVNNLQILTLENCKLDDGDLQMLESGLNCCMQLHKVHLPVNQIGDMGARVLAGCLKRWSNLHDLSLAQNAIGDEGVAVVAESLKACHYLELVNLERNKIGDRGAAKLCENLKNLHCLRELSMEDNLLSDCGIELLEELEDSALREGCQKLNLFLQVM